MTFNTSSVTLIPGSDCKDAFKTAFENRYTWEPDFYGYQGKCIFEENDRIHQGIFKVNADLKAHVEGIVDESIQKAISSQLWEVSIHRVRRSFEEVHGQNTFTAGKSNAIGTEVIVGGKNAGDKYRIKNGVVSMVHRHIHGTLIIIITKNTIDTGNGYLAKTYNSQYFDPSTETPSSGVSSFTDTFIPLKDSGTWVLTERMVKTDSHDEAPSTKKVFKFIDMTIS